MTRGDIMFDQRIFVKLFWIKIFIIIVSFGVIIGYFGYRHAKVPAAVVLSDLVSSNQQLSERMDSTEHRLGSVEHRLLNLEHKEDREKIFKGMYPK